MKPILVLKLSALSVDELVALRRDGFDVPPNIWGAPSYGSGSTSDLSWMRSYQIMGVYQ